MTRGAERPDRGGGCRPGGEDLLVAHGHHVRPGGGVGHEGQPEHLGAEMAGSDGLERCRHPDEVGPEASQHGGF